MELGLFQLENLMYSNSPFRLLDLTGLNEPRLKDVLAKAERASEAEVRAIAEQDAHKPVVLICTDGLRSKALAQNLEREGLNNLYWIGGGSEKLLAEL